MLRDISLAIRNLARRPGFTALVVLTLALGIGGATAVFGVVDAVLLKALPYNGAERILALTTGPRGALSGGDYMDLRDGVSALESIAYYNGGQVNVRTRAGAEFAGGIFASLDFFRVLGIDSLPAGRTFSAFDNVPVAVVTADFAARRFGSLQAALGQQVILYDAPYSIIGVLPSALQFPAKTSVWALAPAAPQNQNRTAHNYRAIARLRQGASLAAAQTQIDSIAARLAAQFPKSHAGKAFRATQLGDLLSVNSRETLLALLGAVLLLLLIACANVANLLLAKGAARTREIAVRSALGAGSWPLVRMLLAESLTLAAASAAAGLALAWAGLRWIVALAPPNTPRLNDVAIDWRVLAFTVLLTLAATALFGLLPAWQSSRVDLLAALKQGGARGVVAGGQRLRRGLVTAEIALAFVLALSSGLLFQSFLKLTEVDPGFRPGGVLVAYAAVPASGAADSQHAAARWFTALSEKLAALPGVESASAAMGVPAGAYNSNGGFIIEGRQDWNTARTADLPQAHFRLAGANYFRTLGIPLRAGRDFTPRDDFQAPFVAIVSESLARRYFGVEDPIGKRLQCGLDSPNWMTIVGIVGDVRSTSPGVPAGPELYMPYAQHPAYADELQIVLRSGAGAASLIEPVRRLVQSDRPDVALKFQTLDGMVAETVSLPRFRTVLLGAFSLIAILLALAGVYGVMAYSVAQRRQEFGVRLAMGATRAGLIRLTLFDALKLAAAGLGIGLGLGYLAQRSLSAFLFEIQSDHPATWALAAAALCVIALAAAWLPARRAAALNPAEVLRGE